VYKKILANANVEMYEGKGKVFDTHTVGLTTPDDEVKHFTAKHILLATGGRGCLAKYSWQGKLFLFLACKFSC
jgi:pyruvate/2-oxoglutarate dehydrogenase complex dihydrolipoamide dehydrogenase (E3) component